MDFRLPNLGEGIESATVTAVLVKPGDAVTAGQNVVAVETDKAAVEVPVESAGTVGEIRVKPGDKVPVGGVILTLQADGASGERPAPTQPAPASTPAKQPSARPAAEAPRPEPPAPQPAASSVFSLPALGEGIEGGTI